MNQFVLAIQSIRAYNQWFNQGVALYSGIDAATLLTIEKNCQSVLNQFQTLSSQLVGLQYRWNILTNNKNTTNTVMLSGILKQIEAQSKLVLDNCVSLSQLATTLNNDIQNQLPVLQSQLNTAQQNLSVDQANLTATINKYNDIEVQITKLNSIYGYSFLFVPERIEYNNLRNEEVAVANERVQAQQAVSQTQMQISYINQQLSVLQSVHPIVINLNNVTDGISLLNQQIQTVITIGESVDSTSMPGQSPTTITSYLLIQPTFETAMNALLTSSRELIGAL
ncbi:MAG: hypothetical protein MUC81_05065 [Bacteroidia bacterium]|jgi:hypothetical protein|nr:hypothetical protein [Bacteroidia bacterium]